MSWLDKILNKPKTIGKKKDIPEGLWTNCKACGAQLYQEDVARQLNVCPKCDSHMRISARSRLEAFLDKVDVQELAADLESQDVLQFVDSKKYKDRITQAQKKSKEKEAMLVMRGRLNGAPIVACSFEFEYIGGSMSSVVGAKFVAAVNVCLEENIPLVCFSASGGARMQEALISLMQMAKTSAALARMSDKGIPYISVLTHPTMGGVSASLAMLGDVNIAEPDALIGFAGPRVIEQTVRETLPDGFQKPEFLLEHGAIDMIVDRRKMRDTISRLLGKFQKLPSTEVEHRVA